MRLYSENKDYKLYGGNMLELNKVYCGNCFDLFADLEENSVDFVFTSPPYNRERNDKYTYYNDALADYFEFLDSIVVEGLRVAKKHLFLNIQATYYNRQDVYKLIGKYADKIQNIIVWGKDNPMPSRGDSLTNAYEFFIVLGDEVLKSNTTYTKNLIITSVNSKMLSEHKAVMHQDVADWFIENFTTIGDIILDPFMGSGTTGISCKKFNRKYIGFEISNEYCELSKSRIDGTTDKVNEGLW
jgi:DNA modification methylase